MTDVSAPHQQRLDKLFAIRSKLGRVHELRRILSLGILWFSFFLAAICGLACEASNRFYLYVFICFGLSSIILMIVIQIYNSTDYETIDASISLLKIEIANLTDQAEDPTEETTSQEPTSDNSIEVKKTM